MFETTVIQPTPADALLSAVEQRHGRYDTLFLGELPYEPLPDDAEVGISGLCRITEKRGNRTPELYDHLDNLPGIVNEILVEHDLAAMDDGDAVFAFIDDAAREKVSAIVSDIFVQWAIAHSRQGLDTLLPSKDSQAKWLVVETAAAVMQAVGEVGNLNAQTSGQRRDVSIIIYNWGPKFATQWFDGTIIKQWMDSESIPEAEQAEWLETFTPSIRKRLAVGNISDPLKALGQVRENLEVHLTDQAIAEHLGWTEAEAREVFTPGVRKRLAVGNISDPLKALSQVKENLEVHLTDQAIAEHLGWGEDEVREVFTPGVRKRFAVGYISDPLKACRDWADGKVSLSIARDNTRDGKLARLGITVS